MKAGVISAVFAILMLLSGSVDVAAGNVPSPFTEGVVDWNPGGVFRDKLHLFEMAIPPDWAMSEVGDTTALYQFLVPESQADSSYRPNLNISVLKGDLAAVFKAHDALLKKDVQGLEEKERKEFRHYGQAALQVTYSLSLVNLKLFCVVWFIHHPWLKDYTVVLTGTALTRDAKTYYPLFKEVFGSFSFFSVREIIMSYLVARWQIILWVGFACLIVLLIGFSVPLLRNKGRNHAH